MNNPAVAQSHPLSRIHLTNTRPHQLHTYTNLGAQWLIVDSSPSSIHVKAAGLEGEPSVRDTTVGNIKQLVVVSSSCIGTRIGSGTDLVSSPLRHHDDAPDLLHLRVVGRADSIQVACNLRGEGKQRQLGTWYILTCYSLHVWEEVNGSWPPAS